MNSTSLKIAGWLTVVLTIVIIILMILFHLSSSNRESQINQNISQLNANIERLIGEEPIIDIKAYVKTNFTYEEINEYDEKWPLNKIYNCHFYPLWKLGKIVSMEELKEQSYEKIVLRAENNGKKTKNFIMDISCSVSQFYENNIIMGVCIEQDKDILFEEGNLGRKVIKIPEFEGIKDYTIILFYTQVPEQRVCNIEYTSDDLSNKEEIITHYN